MEERVSRRIDVEIVDVDVDEEARRVP